MFDIILAIVVWLVVRAIAKNPTASAKIMEYSDKEKVNAQRRMDSTRAHIERMSDEELERKVKKAYRDEGKRDVETMMMAQEYSNRKKND